MANINLTINILDSEGCPTIAYIDTTTLSVTVNGGSPILTDNSLCFDVVTKSEEKHRIDLEI